MPVWHAKTKELVAAGALSVVGIVHEQHPDRAALFAQWKGLDFPILWDPFGVTGLKVVPVATGIDASGVVRLPRPDPRRFDEQFVPEFIEASFESLSATPEAPWVRPGGIRAGSKGALGSIMARGIASADSLGAELAATVKQGHVEGATPFQRFAAGVAHRMRYDSALAKPGDFQSALDAWSSALRADPNQYIWRRRIQQWGPRLDKPYPFYDWIETAALEVAARGETPVAIRARLSGSERAAKSRQLPGASAKAAPEEPDPGGKVARGREGKGAPVSLEIAVAPHTGMLGSQVRTPPGSSRVHLTLRPAAEAKWALDADPPVVWLDLPEGWHAESQRIELPMPKAGTEARALSQDFELSTEPTKLGPPEEGERGPVRVVPGYVVYSICLADGTCVFRRLDFRLTLPFPEPPTGDR